MKLFENNDQGIVIEKNNDLLRIIQYNFKYDSKEQKCEFDFENITGQINERYFENKQLIDLKVV